MKMKKKDGLKVDESKQMDFAKVEKRVQMGPLLYCHMFNNIISLQILQLKNSECFPFGIWKVLASMVVFAGLVYNYVEIYSHLCVGCYIYHIT